MSRGFLRRAGPDCDLGARDLAAAPDRTLPAAFFPAVFFLAAVFLAAVFLVAVFLVAVFLPRDETTFFPPAEEVRVAFRAAGRRLTDVLVPPRAAPPEPVFFFLATKYLAPDP